MTVDKDNLDDDWVGSTIKCKENVKHILGHKSISTITLTSLLPEQKSLLHILKLVGW